MLTQQLQFYVIQRLSTESALLHAAVSMLTREVKVVAWLPAPRRMMVAGCCRRLSQGLAATLHPQTWVHEHQMCSNMSMHVLRPRSQEGCWR